MQPETHYVRNGDVTIAYQVVGDGPFDVVYVPGLVSHLELSWTWPSVGATQSQLASFCRLITFDKRGTGMSDRVPGAPPLETQMDDVRAVMDAAGSPRAALFGASQGAPMSVLFAASYPERTTALILLGSFGRFTWAPDYPWGQSEEQMRGMGAAFEALFFGSPAESAAAISWLGNFDEEELARLVHHVRQSASPSVMESIVAIVAQADVRKLLPAIQAPTLVIHGTEDALQSIEGARYVARQIPGARMLELPGERHLPTGKALERTMEEIERFLRAIWESGGWEEPELDRVLATVLFTDIVGSSERAVELGDRAWRELLGQHHELVRRQLSRFRGREVDTAGDGFLASFDGPARAIRCAEAIVEGVHALGLEVRAGLHTGECELLDGKVAGIAVHTGARVASFAAPGEVLVSSTVKDLVAGSGLAFEDRGAHELKGVPGEWRLFAVER